MEPFELQKDRAILEISGDDSVNFLQSLVTNDIKNNNYSYNFLLNNQGRYLFDFFVLKLSDNLILIDVHKRSLDNLRKKLSLYKLRSKCDLTDCAESYSVIYSKDDIEKYLPQIDSLKVFSIKDPRHKLLGYRSIIKTSNPDVNAFIANNPSVGLYLGDKYEYTIPDGDIDLIYERSIPLEFSAEKLNAISYTKGCYIGQELISRAKYQGVVRKKPYRLIAINTDDDLTNIANGTEIIDSNGETIGAFCSGHNQQGIALLKIEKYLGLNKKRVTIDSIEVEVTDPDEVIDNR